MPSSLIKNNYVHAGTFIFILYVFVFPFKELDYISFPAFPYPVIKLGLKEPKNRSGSIKGN